MVQRDTNDQQLSLDIPDSEIEQRVLTDRLSQELYWLGKATLTLDFLLAGSLWEDDYGDDPYFNPVAIYLTRRVGRPVHVSNGLASIMMVCSLQLPPNAIQFLQSIDESYMPRTVTREEFDFAVEALWSEIEYQNNLPIRTADEADDVPGFLTLLRRYLRKAEDNWCDNAAVMQPEGEMQVSEALHALRKLAGIALRGMIYNGIRYRE